MQERMFSRWELSLLDYLVVKWIIRFQNGKQTEHFTKSLYEQLVRIENNDINLFMSLKMLGSM